MSKCKQWWWALVHYNYCVLQDSLVPTSYSYLKTCTVCIPRYQSTLSVGHPDELVPSLVCYRIVYVWVLLIPLWGLCNLRHLKNLAPFRFNLVTELVCMYCQHGLLPHSIFANFANIFAYSIVFYFDLHLFHLIKWDFLVYSTITIHCKQCIYRSNGI